MSSALFEYTHSATEGCHFGLHCFQKGSSFFHCFSSCAQDLRKEPQRLHEKYQKVTQRVQKCATMQAQSESEMNIVSKKKKTKKKEPRNTQIHRPKSDKTHISITTQTHTTKPN
jgi:hypothetical protein